MQRRPGLNFSWSAELIDSKERQFLKNSFMTIAPKTVVSWTETNAAMADVVFVQGDTLLQSSSPLCICYIGTKSNGFDGLYKRSKDLKVYELEKLFTPSQLLNVFDLMAVWLMQIWSDQQINASSERKTDQAYCLVHWPDLSGRFQSFRFFMAIAAISRRPMTIAEMSTHSGLNSEEIGLLLNELLVTGSVRRREENIAGPTISASLLTPRSRILNKLSKWLQSARSAGTGVRL